LSCHGDPAKSPTGDGKDVLGFPMENAPLAALAMTEGAPHRDEIPMEGDFKEF
jgi:hypothetical protein